MRQAGCLRSRSLRQGCRRRHRCRTRQGRFRHSRRDVSASALVDLGIHTRRWLLVRCTRHKRRVLRHMGRRRRRCRRRLHRPHKALRILRGRQAGCRHSRSPQQGCRHRHRCRTRQGRFRRSRIRTRRSFTRRRCPTHGSTSSSPHRLRILRGRQWLPSQSVPLHTRPVKRQRIRSPHTWVSDTCRRRQMPSASASASQGPPHSPRASSWFPSQSQSPAGMPSPPQMPHSSRTFPSQSQSPSGMSAHPHS